MRRGFGFPALHRRADPCYHEALTAGIDPEEMITGTEREKWER